MDNLSTQEYADEHGVSRRTVQRWIQQGLIFAVKIGREFRIPFDELPPSFFEEQDRTNSDVEAPTSVVSPENAGFPVEVPSERFTPEPTDFFDEDEEGDEEEECEEEHAFDRADLRKAFATRDEALSYAGDIPVSTSVFRRCSDGFFQVVIQY